MPPFVAPSRRTRRFLPTLLLAALLPSLAFFGHWELAVPLPGLNDALVLGALHAAHGGDEHDRHCHGDAASCSDQPAPVGAKLVLLEGAPFGAVVEGWLRFLPAAAWAPHRAIVVAPEPGPPRA